jgi:hypothetical protein
MASKARRMSRKRLRSARPPLGTLNLLQYLQVQLARGEVGVAAAQSTADQPHRQLARIEQPLDALTRG